MGKRRAGRELALKLLFQVDVGGGTPEEVLDLSLDPERFAPETIDFARQLVQQALAHLPEIDRMISRYAKDWSLERMANVDRNILRLAVMEILFMPEIPPSVSADEAVELAKKYSTAESGRFVNGILGNLIRHLEEERHRSCPSDTSSPSAA